MNSILLMLFLFIIYEPHSLELFISGVSSFSLDDDQLCIGNRIEALEIGRQCSRKCKKDVPCENTRKQCLCDGLCGLSCIKPDLSCPELPKLENGDYYPKTNLFDTKVSYQCDEDYYLFGSNERLCQGDEDWSGTPAECLKEAQCHNPPKINHAKNPSDGTYRLEDKIYYSCYPGYQSKGSSEAVCKLLDNKNQTAWLWSSSFNHSNTDNNQATDQFKCIPKSCGDPGQIENAKRHGESFIVASSILYTCNDGYEMIGQARRYCQSDNQWSGQPPQCEPITCNPTDHLENGKINYNYPLIFNSTVEYSCDYGFRLIGPKKRRCGPERSLTGEVPQCEEIDCGELGPLSNGYIKGYSNRMGDKKEFKCMSGMKYQGDHNVSVCLESGRWSNPLPKCLAPCRVPTIEHALSIYAIPNELIMTNNSFLLNEQDGIETTQFKTASTTPTLNESSTTTATTMKPLESLKPDDTVSHDSYIEVVCEKNYELDEYDQRSQVLLDNNNTYYSNEPPRCVNETWTYMAKCKPAKCRGTPPSPKNGRVRVLSIEHGSKGYIHCLDGFRLQGNSVTTCNQGNWTTINSNCLEIYCNFPGIIEHGRVLLVGLTGMYDYKPYIKRISNNRQIAYECENGYRMNDGAPSGATCMDGQWKPEGLPTCIKE